MDRVKCEQKVQQNMNVSTGILDYIYNSIDLSQYRYKIIEYESDLTIITKEKHLLSANFNGTSCLLVFIKIKDKFHSVIVERKTLTYNKNQLNPDTVKMTPVNVRLSGAIYNGTIFDGTYILDKKSKNKIFVITDIYCFNGKNTCGDIMKHKLANIASYLESNMENDNNINNIKLTMNKLYEPTDIKNLITDMDKSKGFEFKGFVFYPVKSGTKLIYLNNNGNMIQNKILSKEITHQNSEKNCSQDICKKKKFTYICKTDDPVYSILEVRKTMSPDVYNIYCVEKNDGYMKLKKLGIALIPDKQSSLMCKNILGSKINGRALMKCRFDSEKNKWAPIEENKERKYPNYISEIEEKLEVIIESESDCDD